MTNSEYRFLAGLVGVASLLLFLNLDNQILWQDEAQTATIAQTVLKYGIPKGYDGKNFFSQEYGAEYGSQYVWRWQTWLSFYVVAASFAVLGSTTFAARFPFVLLGLGTIVLTYIFARSLFNNKRLAGIASILLVLTVPFLILARQSRYYTLAMFLSLLALYAYNILLKEQKKSALLFILSATLLFHAHYIYFATLSITVSAHALLFHRDKVRRILKVVFLSALINLPWMIWLSNIKYLERYGNNVLSIEQFFEFGNAYYDQVALFFFPPALLVVLILVQGIKWTRDRYGGSGKMIGRSQVVGLIFFALIVLAGMYFLIPLRFLFAAVFVTACVVVAVISRSQLWSDLSLLLIFIAVTISALLLSVPYPFLRYIAPLIPVLVIMTAVVIERALQVHPSLGMTTAALLVLYAFAGDVVHEIPAVRKYYYKSPNSLMDDYLYEITHDYRGPMDGIVKYMVKNGAPGDTVIITFEDLPVKFYTAMKVAGGLTGEDMTPYRNPQWIIVRKYHIGESDSSIRAFISRTVDWTRYEKIVLPYADVPFQNREDPRSHQFRTPLSKDSITIFHRKELQQDDEVLGRQAVNR